MTLKFPKGNLVQNIAGMGWGLLIFLYGFLFPAFNFDIIGYSAVVYENRGISGVELNETVYSDLRNEVENAFIKQPGEFSNLIGQGTTYTEYRKTVYEDPEALIQQVPFYSNKLAYIYSIEILTLFGINPVKSQIILSAFSSATSFFFILAIIRMFAQKFQLSFAFGASLIIGLPSLSRLSSPDSLGVLVTSLIAWTYLRGKKSSYLLMCALPLIRLDYILIVILFAVGFIIIGKLRIALYISCITFFQYIAIQEFTDGYGYWTSLKFLIGNFVPYPRDSLGRFPISAYFSSLYESLVFFTLSNVFVVILAVILLLRLSSSTKIACQDPTVFIPAIVAYPIGHLFIFPLNDFRFFAPSLVLGLLFMISRLQSIFKF